MANALLRKVYTNAMVFPFVNSDRPYSVADTVFLSWIVEKLAREICDLVWDESTVNE